MRRFTRDEAVAAMAREFQRAPSSFVEMTTRMLREPGRVWGGAFPAGEEAGVYRSLPVEPMYPSLGRGHAP